MLKNTGERLILDQSWNIMTTLEHVHRYNAAAQFVKDQIVLDAACGTGYGTYMLSKSAKKVYGIDISEDAIVYAREHYKNDNLRYIQMSVETLDFEDEFFDTIISFETIEHITKEQQNAFLNNIKRKLKKSGTLIISTPNDQLLRDLTYGAYINEFHLCEFNEQEYFQFLNNYFNKVKIFYQTVTEASRIMSRENINIGTNYPVFSMVPRNVIGRYYVAICSDADISEETTMESVLFPDPIAYFDEQYFQREAMLFIDSGNGFSDNEKIEVKYICKDGHSFHCEFTLEDYNNINALRFDPCEHGCEVMISSAYTDDNENIQFVPINAFEKRKQYDIFITLDPQYICTSTLLQNAHKLVVEGRINTIPNHIVINFTNTEKDKLKNLNQSMQEQLENAEKEIYNYRKYVHQLEVSLADSASAVDTIENQKKELENYRNYVYQLEENLTNYHSALDIVENQKKELENYRNYVQQLEEELANYHNTLDIMESKKRKLE